MSFIVRIMIKRYPAYNLSSVTELQEVYPGMSHEDITLLLEETWKRPYIFSPWVIFKERPRSGKFVNVDKNGFRISNDMGLALDQPGIKIFVFGGSTTFGYGLDDSSTIPAHIQRQLSMLYPDRDIHVFNFGRAYYYLEQEAILLLELIKNNHIPSVAIFIDGLNEGFNEPFYVDELRWLFSAYNYIPLNLLLGYLHRSYSGRIAHKIVEYINPSTVEEINQQVSSMAKNIDKYIISKEIIALLAEKYNFDVYFFIQPVPGYRNNLQKHMFLQDDLTGDHIAFLEQYMQALEKTVDNHNSFSLTNLLQVYKKQPFVDNVHYTSEVCRMIAEAITEKVELHLDQ